MSLQLNATVDQAQGANTAKLHGEYGIDRSHAAIHNWVHRTDLQPISTVSEDQLAVDEKMIRLHGQQFWPYGAVDPYTNEHDPDRPERFTLYGRLKMKWNSGENWLSTDPDDTRFLMPKAVLPVHVVAGLHF